ncbi:MAG TPA: sugar ABC transporter permease [Rectinema sp.]|nr:sugar ABC transporter permease [Rectinema sp.]HPY05479.1 sugar ABC transporter permease [Rectinema sp.]HQC17309.1 sugar ABC transporter permease [Rectinema sp.]
MRKYSFLWMLLPAFILYSLFIAYPFFSSLGLSFYEWPGIGPKKFIGLANYKNILTGFMSSEFYNALWHNVVFFIWSLILSVVPGLFFAFLLSANIKGTGWLKVVFFFPNTLAIVVVGFLWGLLLNPQWGLINQLFRLVGLDFLAKPWLGDTKTALPTIIFVTAWRGLGFYILIYLAAILGVDREMIEAARIDGASELQIAGRIILPHLYPIIATTSMLKFIWTFNIFDIVYAMEGTQGGPAGSTDVLGTLFYRIAFGGLGASQVGMGLGATVVTLIFLIVLPVSIFYVFIVEKRVEKGL